MPKGILNKASLVMVPEAPIDGTMPSVFPEDRSGDFTFTRGSNLAATRVASNSLIEKGRENLLLQSNQFDTTWGNIVTTEFGGQSGYDGTNDAWKINLNAGTTLKAVTQNFSAYSGVSTASFYAKAGTHSIVQFGTASQSNVFVAFDLSNGSVGPLSAYAIDASATSVGGGWYRIQVAFQAAGAAGFVIAAVDSLSATRFPSTSSTGDFYIQDAQLEVGLVATDYIESGATTGKAGLLENEPRIDFTGGGCGSLLLEPQRTNIITSSEYLGTGFEIGSSTSIDYNDIASPDGYKSASKVTFSAQGTQDYFRFQFTNTANTTYVGSIFLKRGSFDEINVRVSGNAVGMDGQAIFNLANGTFRSELGSVTPKMEDYGNGWYRCSVGDGTNATIASPSFRVSNEGLEPGFVYAWGTQLEAASYPTSYIPTHGNIVTRSEDIGTQLNFSNFFDGYDFTMFLELADNDSLVRANSSSNFRISDTGGTNFGAIRIYRASSSATTHRVVFQDNSQNFNPSSVEIDGDSPKVLVRRIYNTGEFKVFVNGVLKLTATNTDYDMFRFIDFAGGGSSMNIKQIALFPTALTDEECSALTQP